jgi:GT2 family glycosyltransferase
VGEKIASVDVAAIVVNYRTPELTIACVESLLAATGVAVTAIVVDNASGDDSVDRMETHFRHRTSVMVVARDVNDGYAGGNNAGVAIARGLGARYAFVLNSDTIVDSSCPRLLVEEADRDSRTALVMPRIFLGDPPDRLWLGGGRYSLWHGRPIHVGRNGPASAGWTDTSNASFASGCALLIKLSAVTGDPFDASLFSYGEDLDLSIRMRRERWGIRYVPQAVVWHFEGTSHRREGGQALRFYLNTRNLLRVNGRHARWYHWPTLGPLLAVDIVARFSAVAARDGDWGAFAAVWRGALHAFTGGRAAIEPHEPRNVAAASVKTRS